MHDENDQSLPDFITADAERQTWMQTHVQPQRDTLLRWVKDHDDWHGFAGQVGSDALVARDMMIGQLGGQMEDEPPRKERCQRMLGALVAADFPSRDPEDCPQETKLALTAVLYEALYREQAKPPKAKPSLTRQRVLYWVFQAAFILLVIKVVTAWLS